MMEERIARLLAERKVRSEFRKLTLMPAGDGAVDLSSNDYLGLSRSAWVRDRVDRAIQSMDRSGSTGSRLLTGNSSLAESLEEVIADFHDSEAALLMSTGYAANSGLVATLCRKEDAILYDELVHASLREGIGLSPATAYPFRHNSVDHLEQLLEEVQGEQVFVLTESVFSMDGDHAPLKAIAALKARHRFNLIVDEAHALGVFGDKGRGMCIEAGVSEDCFARVCTFGKALGLHGAAILCSRSTRDYLINFCKPFIYSTALDRHFLISVGYRYQYLLKFDNQINRLNKLIGLFISIFSGSSNFVLQGSGPVFAMVLTSPGSARKVSAYLMDQGFDIRPIVYPTVPRGSERLRISLHSFNTEEEIERLHQHLKDYQHA